MEQIIVDPAQSFVSSPDLLSGTLFFLHQKPSLHTSFSTSTNHFSFTFSIHDSNIDVAALSNIIDVDTNPVDSIPEDYYESDGTANGVDGTSDSEHDGLDIEDKNESTRSRFVFDYCAAVVLYPFSGFNGNRAF
jgi:hypothetical protein